MAVPEAPSYSGAEVTMPTFCRHNRLIQNCPICAAEQDVELRPVVSPGGHRASPTRAAGAPGTRSSTGARGRFTTAGAGRAPRAGLTVRRLARPAGDGYHSDLVPGIKAVADAERLADELAFASARLTALTTNPPGLYAEVADPAHDIEERTWLAFQIAYLGPQDGPDPFADIRRAKTSWSSGEPPAPADATPGPRGARDPSRGTRTLDAYRAWARRAGSQAVAFTGEAGWTPDRRFARAFERLALPGLDRGPRFDLLVTLGRLGVYALSAGSLALGAGGGRDRVTLAAKRILGIGDPLLLERRAAELASACEVELETLDLGFDNWERGSRVTMGMDPDAVDESALISARAALGLG